MNNDDYKKIADLVDEKVNMALAPIKTDLTELKTDLTELKQDLKDVKDTQENRVLPSVTYIETNIKAYKDAYQNNNANAKKLEKRVEVLENDANIVPPPELTLAEVS